MDNITTTVDTNIYLPKSFVNGVRKHILKQKLKLEDISEELPYVYRETRRGRFVTEDKLRILRSYLIKNKDLFKSEVGRENLINTINTVLNLPLINQTKLVSHQIDLWKNVCLPKSFVNSIKKWVLNQNIRLEIISEELPYVYKETKNQRSVCKEKVTILLKDLETNKHLFVSEIAYNNLINTIHTLIKD